MRRFHVRSVRFASQKFSTNSAPTKFNSDEYQYLEKSVIPTLHFQRSLPRLPIPRLEKTFQRYLAAVRPILNDEQFKTTSKLAENFEKSDAVRLHKELVAIDSRSKHTSYISEPWFDMYLKARVPLPINYNPFMAWNLDPDKKYNDQVCKAANIIISACRFKRSLDANILQPEIFHLNPTKSDTKLFRTITSALPQSLSWYGAFAFKAYPLDMSQHPSLFNTTRIPALGRDQLHRNPSAKHLIVMKKGHIFAVDVMNEDGTIKTPDEIQAYLNHINCMQLQPCKSPLGLLTTFDRDTWAQYRSQLIQAGNEQQLKTIDDGLFVLCLDDGRTEDPLKVAKNLLHADGINRWFDKSLSVIVQEDGLAAVNFEHSWGDGVAVLRFMEEIYKDTCKNHWVKPTNLPSASVDCSKSVRKLEFKITDAIQNVVDRAKSADHALGKNLDFSILQYRKMDRDYLKKQKLSPDAVLQLAIQAAFYRINNSFVATYESCSTSAFKHGRTETVRPATDATNRFVRALLSTKNKPTPSEFRSMMEECSKVHTELVKNAAMGQGFDRHLFSLRSLIERRGEKFPAFFADPTYQLVNHYTLSTSTLSTPTIMIGGFGPVVPDGLGIGYNVVPQEIGCIVTGYGQKRNPTEFTQSLEKSLDDIKEIFENCSK